MVVRTNLQWGFCRNRGTASRREGGFRDLGVTLTSVEAEWFRQSVPSDATTVSSFESGLACMAEQIVQPQFVPRPAPQPGDI